MRAIRLLLVNSFLMNVSFFAFIPFLSSYITRDLALSAGIAGVVLMIRQLTQQGTSFISGMLGDRFDYRLLISTGMILRGGGFVLFSFCTTPMELIVAAIIAGIGGSLFEPTSKAAMSIFSQPSKRGDIFALDKIVRHSGIIFAGILGGMLLHLDFFYSSFVCGRIFIFIGLITFFNLPKENINVPKQSFKDSWQKVKSDRQFIYFTICMIGFWIMFMQLYLTIPLHATEVFYSSTFVSGLFIVYGMIVVILQYPLQKWTKMFSRLSVIKVGMAIMGAGMLLIGLSDSLLIFWGGFCIYAVGIMLVEPTSYEYTSEIAPPQFSASYFGFSLIAMAIGGSLSQGAGGWLFEHMPDVNWIICTIAGFISAIGIQWLQWMIKRHLQFEEEETSNNLLEKT
ncbi:MFS transporter [Bacillus sp. S/N-304-OC-R1]|uniref:MDR family MFS transporter n=1 Tax=Bacillus sp. S/N-304-OC-R1 TaxID=2758034 RepID=UPI001C8D3E18|nr:MFS transporter [Bacillus sp. S/N-304-OC-R1]MBY0121644.1 MFS transporter [Bacillus sp. S/N-304-OC-R1]